MLSLRRASNCRFRRTEEFILRLPQLPKRDTRKAVCQRYVYDRVQFRSDTLPINLCYSEFRDAASLGTR